MRKNPFKDIEKEHPPAPKRVEKRAIRTVNFMQTVAHTVDLYVPKAAKVLVALFGGDSSEQPPPATKLPSANGQNRLENGHGELPPNLHG